MNEMKIIFYYLVFPGFVFTLILGIIASWIERKLTARLQWRVGPPFLQPLYDLLKLFSKENVIPENAHLFTFIAAPLLSFVSSTLVATIVGLALFKPAAGFQGDLIVVVYLLTIPSLCLILGGAASSNPLASLGSSREMKLILSYELVFWASVSVIWIKTKGLLILSEIISFQKNSTPLLASFSGMIVFILALITMQAKLGKVPFDIAEAETEIMAGPYIEYSGPLLGFFKISQYILLIVIPFFLLTIFWGGRHPPTTLIGSGTYIIKYLVLLLIIVLLENTNPRLKISQSLYLFWFILFPLSIIAIILALMGF